MCLWAWRVLLGLVSRFIGLCDLLCGFWIANLRSSCNLGWYRSLCCLCNCFCCSICLSNHLLWGCRHLFLISMIGWFYQCQLWLCGLVVPHQIGTTKQHTNNSGCHQPTTQGYMARLTLSLLVERSLNALPQVACRFLVVVLQMVIKPFGPFFLLHISCCLM